MTIEIPYIPAINCIVADHYRWILGISPSGSNNLLSSLKTIFESGSIFEEEEESEYM